MNFNSSPLTVLSKAIKKQLSEDDSIFAILSSDPKRIDLQKFTSVGEDDIPIIAISAFKEDFDPLNHLDDERSEVTVLIESVFPRSLKINPEDYAYHLRHLILGMPKITFSGGNFERLKSKTVHYVRTTIGRVPVSHIVCEMATSYDDSIEHNAPSKYFEGPKVSYDGYNA